MCVCSIRWNWLADVVYVRRQFNSIVCNQYTHRQASPKYARSWQNVHTNNNFDSAGKWRKVKQLKQQ